MHKLKTIKTNEYNACIQHMPGVTPVRNVLKASWSPIYASKLCPLNFGFVAGCIFRDGYHYSFAFGVN